MKLPVLSPSTLVPSTKKVQDVFEPKFELWIQKQKDGDKGKEERALCRAEAHLHSSTKCIGANPDLRAENASRFQLGAVRTSEAIFQRV